MFKDKCAIVIPLYTNKLKKYENESISSARKNFPNDDIYFVCPNTLDISNIEADGNKIIRYDGKYFNGISGYCLLCTSAFFYKTFEDMGYTYMLIHQTDCYTFYNALEHFMELGYDYYGSPISINDKKSKWYGGTKVGNGGYSLRKLETMIKVCTQYGQTTTVEDVWFCVTHRQELNICPVNIAKSFSTIATNIKTNLLPMGCHGYLVKNNLYTQYIKRPKAINFEDNKKVVYTCITGGYDELLEPKIVNSDFDYVCYTDKQDLTSDVWEIRPIPENIIELDNVRRNRYVKTHPHILFPEYETSIYVDGSVKILGDLNNFVKTCDLDNYAIAIPKHPSRTCIYKESKICISIKKDTAEHINPQIEKYRKEGFPENYGLTQNNIIVRKHNDENCIKVMEEWWQEILNGSYRDQLSLFYVLWKNPDVKIKQLSPSTCNSSYFKWYPAHTKKKVATTVKSKTSQVQKNTQEINNTKQEIEKLQKQINELKKKLNDVKQTNNESLSVKSPSMTVLYRENENRMTGQKKNVVKNVVIRQKKRINKSNMSRFF